VLFAVVELLVYVHEVYISTHCKKTPNCLTDAADIVKCAQLFSWFSVYEVLKLPFPAHWHIILTF